ncbi:MAG: type II CRISPR-associated endonuclease Cas1 [Bacteroidetes bacterium]|nr:type II CRISPR-associated endonuclease Cas1 [Bacteroidota bacterium]
MLKRTLFISNPCYISTRFEQLVLKNKKTDEEKTVPIEDLGFVVFENGECTFSLQAISKLNENNVAAIFCNDKHLPTSLLLNLDANDIQSQLFSYQINAAEPLKKQLWQQTIKAKILNQAGVLQSLGIEIETLKRCAANIKSGDTSNEEAKASRYYWSRLFNYENLIVSLSRFNVELLVGFTRSRFGDPPNNLFNYGYAILRAATARALAGSGLLPTLGIHHHNKYNAFCLADDIMEPYRPFVDKLVYEIIKEGTDYSTLTTPIKSRLLGLLTVDVQINNSTSPLMVGLSQTTASLAECFKKKRKTIKYPSF